MQNCKQRTRQSAHSPITTLLHVTHNSIWPTRRTVTDIGDMRAWQKNAASLSALIDVGLKIYPLTHYQQMCFIVERKSNPHVDH